jgi:protein SCO1
MDMNRRNLLTRCTLVPLALLPSAVELAARPAPHGKPVELPNVPLVTHDKRRVHFYDDLVRGNRLVLINFMYAQCSEICPGMTANLVQVQRVLGKRVGREVFMYSISLLPEQDSPEVLAAYAKGLGAGPGWTFLTGQGPDIETLRRGLGYADPNPELDSDITQHIGMVRIGNDALGRWMACPALARPRQIAQEAMWIGLAPKT